MVFGYNSISDLSKGYDGKLRQNKRKLSDRSHLTIEFPQENDRVIRTFIPFLENPTISEKGKANINSYNLVGRAGQLFTYGGSESRTLQVTFNISLLHVLEEEKDLQDIFKRQFKLFFSEKSKAKSAFNISKPPETLNPDEVEDLQAQSGGLLSFEEASDLALEIKSAAQRQAASDYIGDANTERGVDRDHAGLHRDYYRMLVRGLTKQELAESDNELQNSFVAKIQDFAGLGTPNDNINKLNGVINLVYAWVNLIRGSVLNNSTNTVFGPPIVRLTHGPMYNNVPCLLQDYSINIVEEAGYDVATLTPKRIQISLNLIESRTGNFGKFSAGRIGDGDNLTGWESVIETNNIDPYNGLIGSEDGEFGSEL
jgi:hypothetical protein